MGFSTAPEMASTTYCSPFQNSLHNKGLIQKYFLEKNHEVCDSYYILLITSKPTHINFFLSTDMRLYSGIYTDQGLKKRSMNLQHSILYVLSISITLHCDLTHLLQFNIKQHNCYSTCRGIVTNSCLFLSSKTFFLPEEFKNYQCQVWSINAQ